MSGAAECLADHFVGLWWGGVVREFRLVVIGCGMKAGLTVRIAARRSALVRQLLREPLPPPGHPNVCSWRHLAARRRDCSTRRRGSQVTRQSRYVVFQQVEAYLRLGWMVQTPAQPYKVLSSAHPDGQAMRLQNSPGQTRPSTAMEGRAGAIRAAVRPRPLEQAARPEPAQLHAPLRSETFAATRNNARSARKRRRQ